MEKIKVKTTKKRALSNKAASKMKVTLTRLLHCTTPKVMMAYMTNGIDSLEDKHVNFLIDSIIENLE